MSVTNDLLHKINNFKNLKWLRLSLSTRQNFNLVPLIKNHPGLEYFNSSLCIINDQSFEQLCLLKELKELHLADLRRDHMPLFAESIKVMNHLQILHIHDSKLDEQDFIRQILEVSSLMEISRHGCKHPDISQNFSSFSLTSLNISFAKSVDSFVKAICNISTLKSLDISASDISSSGFLHVRALQNLEIFKMKLLFIAGASLTG